MFEGVLFFVGVAMVFVMTPGIDTFYVLNISLNKGRDAGVLSGLGVNLAMFIQILVFGALMSLGWNFATFLLPLLKGAGAIYLGILGGRLILNDVDNQKEATKEEVKRNAFWGGLRTNFLNPKAGLFILAFFPQFTHNESYEGYFPFLKLGIIYSLLGTLWFLLLALFGAQINKVIKFSKKGRYVMNYLFGLLFIFMAFVLLVTP